MNGQQNFTPIDPFEMQLLQILDLETIMQGDFYEEATAELETIAFDAIIFESRLNENALQFLTFKIFK